GKAAGTKKKKTDAKGGKKAAAKKPAAKAPSKRNTINKPKSEAPALVSQDGLAPLKRRKPAAE
ncbi:ATP-dependent helicase, partial [Pseudomonas sp. CrR25]|nr:ATP-dependent helicase [Pseudomonas sp. CrR25]